MEGSLIKERTQKEHVRKKRVSMWQWDQERRDPINREDKFTSAAVVIVFYDNLLPMSQ